MKTRSFPVRPVLLLGAMVVVASFSFAQRGGPPPPANLSLVNLPSGFRIDLWAEGVNGARSLARGEDGTVFVGTMNAGNVYALRDADGDHKADAVVTIASGLNNPNGLEFRDGSLYVAEINRILRYDGIESRLASPPPPVVLKDDLPTDFLHGWKYLEFGPDGRLYFAIGAPCNICEPDEPYASIASVNPDGSDMRIFARGVRNSVGLAFHPDTGELWFTDNGRDQMGNNLPADELNHAPEAGLHFGYPYCHQGDLPDPEFGRPGVCREYTPPSVKMGPHVAAIGLEFYTGDMFPDEYDGQLFIAHHGSWNRPVQPLGYRLAVVHFQDGVASGLDIFADGFLQGVQAWGRPVDILQMPDGSLLVSDDLQGKVYRISYSR